MNDENEEMKVIRAIKVIKERQDAEDEREQDKATRDAIADANIKGFFINQDAIVNNSV
jgi:hypothetical protein